MAINIIHKTKSLSLYYNEKKANLWKITKIENRKGQGYDNEIQKLVLEIYI